jgi:hypothetical protein
LEIDSFLNTDLLATENKLRGEALRLIKELSIQITVYRDIGKETTRTAKARSTGFKFSSPCFDARELANDEYPTL